MSAAPANLTREPFGTAPDGRTVERVTLHGADGFAVSLISYGAAVQRLLVPDSEGRLADVVLGHDDLSGYIESRDFFGATIGRVANRIAGGRFMLNGRTIRVEPNDGPNALHGGGVGFDRYVWDIAETEEGASPAVTFRRRSPDGEEGFPGNLDVAVTYRVSDGFDLEIEFTAETDMPTVVNLTNHSFFNLGGGENLVPVYDHELRIAAERYSPVDSRAIPKRGAPEPVEGTPFDFREAAPIGALIRFDHPQLNKPARGYDHNFVLANDARDVPAFAARVRDPRSGRVMELWTDRPGLQFYSGNFLDGSVRGKNGRAYRQADAFCLEPQDWPDAPNRPDFPSVLLDPGQTYRHRSLLRFFSAAPAASRDTRKP